ncbi:MAG TPA: CPXCG motif-containing cysteine-rich protein [Bacteroidota bacterium]|nr:CPXCG motif-containing cysteine-rich protein [Bacteroidota bacterium]
MRNEELGAIYICAVCGEENETLVDPSAGALQTYVEDCSVCCRPNVLTIRVDESTQTVLVESEFEG